MAMATIETPPELAVGEGYGMIRWDVRAIWELYGGWFHHRSTTELTGTPPDAAHADLVDLAGGPEAVVERARQRLDDGDPEVAIRLLETVVAHRG